MTSREYFNPKTMRQSQLFAKTKREAPKEAEIISHKFLVRADFIEQSFSGVWRFLPLGWMVHKKIEGIIRDEMLALGAQEIFLPALQNKNLWHETGRWEAIDPPLFKLKDRHQKETALGSTHEEEVTDIARKRIKSWQDLPFSLFQIQNKFRNEMRPSGGLLRTKEFIMKDLYSFHSNEKDLEIFYQKVQTAYRRIFKKCGLEIVVVRALGGAIGGKKTDEFMAVSDVGEDRIAVCRKCGFAANIEAMEGLKICPDCKNELQFSSSIELAHTFNLGTKYSQVMRANFTDKDGKSKPVIMGCYGIGLGRLIGAIAELNHDEKGIIWPKDVAPFQIHLIRLGSEQKIKKAAEKLHLDLQKKCVEVLYDDRNNKSPGEKFAEADLIGIPWRIVTSERTLVKDSAEVKARNKQVAFLVKLARLSQFLNSKCKSQNSK